MNGWQEKRFLRHWRRLHVKSWQLVLLLVAGVLCTVFLLRQNNLRMVALREAVVAADKNGADVTGALERLNYHVFHHMNTKIVRPVELVNTYNRQAQAVIEAANKNSGRDVYAEATAACERRGIPLASIAQCAAEYAVTNNPGVGPQQIVLPDKNRFIYSFASPLWTPDLAGFSLLLTGVVLLWLLGRILEYVLVRLVIRKRLRNNF
ncbi:MAG: hypothetical protein U0520_02020 [Candidatus Saccharimonadales bacterium]